MADMTTRADDRSEEQQTEGENVIIRNFLCERVPVFRELVELQRKGWENPKADEHFAQQRQRSGNANTRQQRFFFEMRREIGDELQAAANIIPTTTSQDDIPLRVLDLCMAPGGYTATVLKYSPSAHVCGISLPTRDGGHRMLVKYNRDDPNVQVEFRDITMLAKEFDTPGCPISEDHPDRSAFSNDRPFFFDDDGNTSFDLIFCDGQVLRTHERASRSSRETTRLACAQLILALQRIRPGGTGTVVMLLHRLASRNSLRLLRSFSLFAEDVRLFKSARKHTDRGSFYLVAKGVDPGREEARRAVERWKWEWWMATVKGCAAVDESIKVAPESLREEESLETVLEEFGEAFIRLGEPVWRIQKEALERASYMKE